MKIKQLVVAGLLGMTCLQVAAQTELRGWHVSPNLIDLQSVNTTTAATVKPAWFGAPTMDQGAYNSIYDSEGKLLFYVMPDLDMGGAYTVFNKFHNPITFLMEVAGGGGAVTAPGKRRTNISIIPNPDNGNCISRYYIVYEGDYEHKMDMGGPTVQYGIDVLYMEIDMNMNSGLGGVSTPPTILYSVAYPSRVGFAVSKLNTSGQRFLYMNGERYIGKEMRMSVVTSTGISPATAIATPLTVNKGGTQTAELELSEDGTKLLWAEGSDVGGTGTNDVNIMYLVAATGLPTGAANYVFSSTSLANRWKGVEFDKTGRFVFFTVPGVGIYVRDLNTSTQVLIAGTAAYSNSILEKSYDGNSLICASQPLGQIRAINLAGLPTIATVTLNTWTTSYTLPAISASNFALMPDQIDGEDYDLPTVTNVDVDLLTVSANATWTPGGNPAYTVNVNTSLKPQSSAWPLRVATGIVQTNNSTVNIDGLTVQFHTNAYYDVNGGSNLYLLNAAKLEGHTCGLMWRGVSMNNNASSSPSVFSMTSASKVYDAIRGVVINGQYVTTTINGGSEFNKNERSLILNGVTPSITSVYSANFWATAALKDQTYGSVINGGTIRYGISGIEISNSGTAANRLTIGTATAGNLFQSGQYGIYATASDILVQKNNFTWADSKAITVNGNWGNRSVDLVSNTFNSNRNCTNIFFGCNLKAIKNTFAYTTERCIDWNYNFGNKLEVGTSSLADANTFDSFGWWAVVVSYCDNVGTDIGIHNNTIKNSPWATGIYIGEPTMTSNATTYKGYLIDLNTFTSVGTGVKIVNVKGNAFTNYNDDQNLTNRFDIYDNTINYSTAYDASARGIRLETSHYNRVYNNTINSDNSSSYLNAGINLYNCENNLVKKNRVKAGRGIFLELDVLGSNILCNTLDNCVAGIEADWSWLRGTGVTHGSVGAGRQNFFINANTSDMLMNNVNPATYQWVSPNTTAITYTPSFTGSIISTTTGLSPCGPGGTRMADPGSDKNSVFSYENDLQEYTAKVYTAKLTNDLFMQKLNEVYDKKAAGKMDNIEILAKANVLLNSKEYSLCQTVLNAYTPTGNEVESNLFDFLRLQNNKALAGRYAYTAEEKAGLIGIAQKDSRTGGQGVVNARSVVLYEYNLSFNDLQADYKIVQNSVDLNAAEDLQNSIVFPNPTTGTVKISSMEQIKSVKVTTITGALVTETTTTEIDLSSYPSGMYFFTISTENENKVIKVIKE